jgi:hypothetical protein
MRAPGMLMRMVVALAMCATAFTVSAASAAGIVDTRDLDRQILVMLRTAPAHFRPDVDYSGGYDTQIGRADRKRVASAIAAKFNLRMIDDWPMPSLGIDCFVMQVPDDVPLAPIVEYVAHDARVEWVQDMHRFHSLAHNDPLYPAQPTANLWHLSEIHLIATGRNVRVAEIDSGVEVDHPDLAGRILVTRNFVDAVETVAETHGTAVAGIIGARADDAIGIAGVAPQASLLALRACWQTPAEGGMAVCSSFTLAKAIQFAIDQDAKVINLSLGGPRDRLLATLLELAASRGVVVVAASDPSMDGGGFPASMPGIIAVSADGDANQSEATYIAPGHDIPTTLPGRRWGFVSGSSFAAAEVSGLAAVLLEIAPHQSSKQIQDSLHFANVPRGTVGTGRVVDACGAVARTSGVCACGCSNPAISGLAVSR